MNKAFTHNSYRIVVTLISFVILLMAGSCSKAPSPHVIAAFSLENADGSPINPDDVQVVIKGDSIDIEVAAAIDITRLIPVITIQGITISPASGVVQDFSQPVLYTVTGSDGNSSSYVVTVHHVNPKLTMFVGNSGNYFYALDAQSGTLLWQYQGDKPFAYSKAAYDNGTVYVGGIDGYLYAFDAVKGTVRWKFFAGNTGIESNITLANGILYFGSDDDNMYAVDACTGEQKWKFTTGANVSSSPLVADSVVYFGSSDSRIYAVDATNGQLKWSYATEGMINQSDVALANGTIFAGSRDGNLYALNKNTGQLNWSFSADGVSLEASSPVVADTIVYFGSWVDIYNSAHKGCLYAVNINSGKLIWKQTDIKEIDADPVVADNRLFITSGDGILYAVDPLTGAIFWQKTIYSNAASPAVYNGTVYVGGGGSHYIYAFNAATGDILWRFGVNGLMTSTPLITMVASRVNDDSSCIVPPID